MQKINKMDRETVKRIRPEIEKVLVAALANAGLVIEVGNARFDSTFVEFKVKFRVGAPQ